MSHTPGPWTVATARNRDGTLVRYIKDSDGWVISLRVENEDDARLIAAAPDLLAALVAMLAESPNQTDAGDAARAAIAKAEELTR